MRLRWPVALAALTLLAACAGPTSGPENVPEVEPDPTTLGEPAPSSQAVEDASLPLALQGMPLLDAGWDQVPKELDGTMLGLVHPEEAGPLRFVAADEDGTLLWQAERPPSCTGFTLSRTGDGQSVAVLTDVQAGTDTVNQTSASAYDLITGELLWGPVEVPGPHQGPGTVFAAPAPGASMGDAGPRLVLDTATGEELVNEEDGDVVVGEYDGVVLTARDGVLSATGGGASWELTLADLGLDAEPVALPGTDAPAGTALIGDSGDWAGVLVDVASGEVLAEGAAGAVREPVSGTLVTLETDESDGELVGYRIVGYPEAGERWELPADGAQLGGAGNVFVYLRTDTTVRAVNAVTGEDAVAYDDGTTNPAVPVLATAGGAAVVEGAGLALVPAATL